MARVCMHASMKCCIHSCSTLLKTSTVLVLKPFTEVSYSMRLIGAILVDRCMEMRSVQWCNQFTAEFGGRVPEGKVWRVPQQHLLEWWCEAIGCRTLMKRKSASPVELGYPFSVCFSKWTDFLSSTYATVPAQTDPLFYILWEFGKNDLPLSKPLKFFEKLVIQLRSLKVQILTSVKLRSG